ncbi:hypothetical protein NCCP28_35530 [Niallia sp. NCCP-28]|nr:hypothetical protein NCCP28_35530 [Niallia sp. NCCP-28]
MEISNLANTYKLPYYAVVFASERTEGDNGYGVMAAKMDELASVTAKLKWTVFAKKH